jgi:hypothetical protein
VYERIDSRIKAESVSDSTIIGVQTGLDEQKVGDILDSLLRVHLKSVRSVDSQSGSSLELEIASATKAEVRSARDLNRLTNAYEYSLELLGASEEDVAVAILQNVITQLAAPTVNHLGHTLRARAALRLGAIRRDKGHLGGLDGAFGLFGSAFETADYLGDRGLQTEAAINLASSHEMSEQYDAAYRSFADAHELALVTGDVSFQLWARIRQQTIITKSGESALASGALETLATATSDLETPNLRRVCLLKRAAALKESGDYDGALAAGHEAANLVAGPSDLILVQHDVLLADIYLSAGMEHDGVENLARAEGRALRHGYAHQLRAIDRIFATHLGIPVGPISDSRRPKFTPVAANQASQR